MSTPSADGAEPRILIVNQHGDNTGDESALRAMLNGLDARVGPATYTVVHQFRERSSEIDVPQPVRWITLRLPGVEPLRLVLYVLTLLLRRPRRGLLGPVGLATIEAYETADLVVSAPGGPYFGDRYWSHEPVHWLYVWLARWHEVPCALYAPSAGPFEKRWMNPFRRATYRCFDVVTLREERSAAYLRGLMGADVGVEVTADAALQERVAPIDRAEWIVDGADLTGRFVVAVSVIDAPYPGDADPAARRAAHDDAVVAALQRVADRLGEPAQLHVAFVPQLRSRRHDDAPYLRRLAHRMPTGCSWEVVDAAQDSNQQRSRFAAADLVLAGRYHPAVFAVSAGVPLVCIAYEHKASGLMEAAGLARVLIELDDVTSARLEQLVDRALDEADTIRAHLREVEPVLRARSARTSEAVAEVVSLRAPR